MHDAPGMSSIMCPQGTTDEREKLVRMLSGLVAMAAFHKHQHWSASLGTKVAKPSQD